MLLRQLEYFRAVAECNGFTAASQRCHVSQSAISQQIKSLERELGCELLLRSGRHIELTPAGELALSAARETIDRIDRMRFEIEHLADGDERELRVGYLSRYEGWEVPSAVAAFTLRHPEIAVTATPGSHEELYQRMIDGNIDLAFSDRRRELSDEFENIHLTTRYTVIEVSEANALSAHDQVSVSELADSSCILVATGETRAAERAYFRDTLNFPCPFVFANSLEEAHLMVAGNRGFLPLEVRDPNVSTGKVIRHIPLVAAEGQLVREYFAFWPKRRTNWLVREFAHILGELLA